MKFNIRQIRIYKLFSILIFLVFICCIKDDSNNKILERHRSSLWINFFNKELTGVIISDVFSPPQTSRIYAYSNIAAYEAMRVADDIFPSLLERLNGFDNIPNNEILIDPVIAGITAFNYVGKRLVYDSLPLFTAQNFFYDEIKSQRLSPSLLKFSKLFGDIVGEIIFKRSTKDGYLERTANSGYLVEENNMEKWQPTPPAYIEAIEPHWNTLIPFTIDSAQQFKPKTHTPFSIIKNSKFHNQAIEVYEAVNNLDEEQRNIAMFWDCNPNQSNNFGHLMFNSQQISPAGHWIHITCQVVDQENLSNLEASYALAKVGITLADSFIISWDEKYRSNLIRPETYINKYIDSEWKPILETPPFPEYTSAHSAASKAASLVLADLFGDNFAYIDSTEIPFGMPTRKYKSFKQASDEAAISRLFGGIHYKPAVEAGKKQGEDLGNFIINKLDDGINFKTLETNHLKDWQK